MSSSHKPKDYNHTKTENPSSSNKKIDLEGMATYLISKLPKQNSLSTTIGQQRPPFHSLFNFHTLKEIKVPGNTDKNDDNGIGSDNGSTEYEVPHITRITDNKTDKRMILKMDTDDFKRKQIAIWNVNVIEEKESLIDNNNNKLYHKIDECLLNKMNMIYDNVIKEFQCNNNNNNEHYNNVNNDTECKYKAYIKKTKAIEYVNFVLSKEYLNIIQNIINNNTHITNSKSSSSSSHIITAFFIYQIYLFTSLIFIPLTLLTHDNTLMSYVTAFNYSKQSLHLLTNNINESSALLGADCLLTNNKIIKNILSVLTLTFDIPETVLPSFQYNNIDYKSTFEEVFKIVKDLTVCEELQIEIMEIRQSKEEVTKQLQNEIQMNKIMLLICLDEIIVKYVSENNEEYVLTRPHANKFIIETSKHYRIGIFTNNTQEYGDYVIESIDHNKKVEIKLYNDVFNEDDCLDFEKLNMKGIICDLKKVIVIESVRKKDKYKKCNCNSNIRKVIYIEEFNGDEHDTQLLQLQKNLKDLTKE